MKNSIPRPWLVFTALCASMLAVLAVDAAGVSDKGVRVQFTATPLAMPYLGLSGHAVVGAKQTSTSTLGSAFSSAFRGDVYADKGGAYGAAQTAFAPFNAEGSMGAQGQLVGLWTYGLGRGKGNVLSVNGVVDCYGGGEIYDGSGASTPECAALGEFEADQGQKIFGGTISSAGSGATTITYSSPTNEDVAGSRLILSLNHVYATGTISSATGTAIVGSGTSWVSAPLTTGTWYLKIGTNNDNYSPACGSGDVQLSNGGTPKCVGHWYRVCSFTDATHLTLCYPYDATNLPSSGTYLMLQGEEATAVDMVANTFTFPANTLNWAASETFYSPPNHVQSVLGLNIILNKVYKTGESTAPSEGIRIVNDGAQYVDFGLRILGDTAGFKSGITMTDLGAASRALDIRTDVAYGMVIRSGDNTCSKNAIAMGNSGQDLQCFDGTNHSFYGVPTELATGVAADGGGLKHKRASTGSISASTTSTVTVSWATSFTNANYTVTCVVDDSSDTLRVLNFKNRVAASVDVRVQNTDGGGAHTGTLHCMAMHDGS
jgi:hypothetical protein